MGPPGPIDFDLTPFIIIGVMIGIMLYLAFGAVSGLIAAIFIRNASYGMSAVIGMATTVGGGLVFAGFFALAEYIGEPIDSTLFVVAMAVHIAIVIATFVVMVILIRRIGRSAPE